MVRPADERKNRTQDQRDNPSASPNGVIVPNHRNQVVFAEASLGIVGQTTAWITENPVRVHAAHFGELSCALFDEMPRPTVRIKLSVYVPTAGGLRQSKGLVMIQLLQLDQRGCFLERLASPSHTTVPGFPLLSSDYPHLPHRTRIQPHLPAPRLLRRRDDFRGLDFAAAAPEGVGVSDGDASSTRCATTPGGAAVHQHVSAESWRSDDDPA
jgi:hypothetical protein